MYGVLAAGYGDWPIIHQIAWLLGKLMNGIYIFLDTIFNVQNIGVCIILFTIIIYTLMIPLTIKQQKWSKVSAAMNPELQKIQKKYKGRTDQASQLKQQEETQALYDKYGISMSSGCLPMLIQFPILFALYPVIQDIPRYVDGVKDVYMPVVEQIMSVDGFQKIMETIGKASPVLMNPSSYDYSQADTLVSVLYKFQDSTWTTLVDKMPSLEGIVSSTMQQVEHLNNFLGINIGETPWTMLTTSLAAGSIVGIISAVIIPLLAGLAQFLSVKLQPAQQTASNSNDPTSSYMKSMTYTMPLISVFMGFTLPAGLGLYWAISAAVRCVQQIAVNKYLSKKTVEEMIEENQKKAAKKREKKGTPAKEINKMATTSTRNVESQKKSAMTEKDKQKKLDKAAEYSKNADPGSLSSKAYMVSRFNSGHKEKDIEKKS
jgi:YidC/Oxa1 family membrane protein insertase